MENEEEENKRKKEEEKVTETKSRIKMFLNIFF